VDRILAGTSDQPDLLIRKPGVCVRIPYEAPMVGAWVSEDTGGRRKERQYL
jgi:hypothetical protein